MTPETEVTDLQAQLDAARGELEAEHRLRDELVSAASHDLRSPIGAINIFCEILMSGPHGLDESQTQSVRMIADAAEKLQRILEDTVEIARMHSGRTPRLTHVDARACAEDCIKQIEALAHQRGVRLVPEWKATASSVLADHDKLCQVILKLVSDAIRSARKDSEVHIQDSSQDGQYQLTVTLGGDYKPVPPSDGAQVYFPKGKLGVRKPGDSRYTIATCEKALELFKGSLKIRSDHHLQMQMQLPLA